MRRLGALLVPTVLIGVACAASTAPAAPAPGQAAAIGTSPAAKATSAGSTRPVSLPDADASEPARQAPGAIPESEARSDNAPAVTGEGRANGPSSPVFIQLLPRDAIKPVYSPEYRTAQQVVLDPEDLVIGVSIAGEHRAYPIKTLAFSEMVNDVLGGSPILVSW